MNVDAKPATVEAKPATVEAKPAPVEAKPTTVEAKPAMVEATAPKPEAVVAVSSPTLVTAAESKDLASQGSTSTDKTTPSNASPAESLAFSLAAEVRGTRAHGGWSGLVCLPNRSLFAPCVSGLPLVQGDDGSDNGQSTMSWVP